MNATAPLFDAAEVQKALAVMVEPGSVFEVRILNPVAPDEVSFRV